MDTPIELSFGYVLGYQPKDRFYTVQSGDGRRLDRVRKIGEAVNNTGGRQVQEIEPQTEVLLVLQYGEIPIDAPEAFIIGAFESFGADGTQGTTVAREQFPPGTQGFADKKGRRLILYPDGRIALRSGAWCKTFYDPQDNSIAHTFQRLVQQKDPQNFFKWIFHPESDELDDALLHWGIAGLGSKEKAVPDIEILAGALHGLSEEDFLHAGFPVDDGATFAARISNPDAETPAQVVTQVGRLTSGHLLKINAATGDLEAEFGLGEMEDGDTLLTAEVNKVHFTIKKNGDYIIKNDKTEVEGKNDGTMNVVCEKSNLGTKGPSYHHSLSEETIKTIEALCDAILNMTIQTTGPGSPTAPKGVLNAPKFRQVKQMAQKIKSEHHGING